MTKKLYVGNLPFGADEAQLKAHFETDGRQVASVKIMMDRETGRSRGFAFVEMGTPEDAQKAITALHNQAFMGRPLTVNEAREQAPRVGGFGGPRPNGNGPGGGGFNRGDRPSGGGFRDRGPGNGGFGGGFPPSGGAGFEPPPEDRGGRASRDRGKERDKDRRRRGQDDDWS